MMGRLLSITALLGSFAILCLGHGLQSVLLPARGAMFAEYANIITGVMMSAYYLGFISGTFVCPKLIDRVGHIRVFAAGSAGAAVVMLCHALTMHPLIWILLRGVYGFCMIHMYMVMESWLNSIGEKETRGKILSIYMITNFIAMSGGQLLFFLAPVEGFELFSISAMMLSLALLPLILSQSVQPAVLPQEERFGVKQLLQLSPLGVAGSLIAGLIGGAYWGLTALYIVQIGFSQQAVAWFMSASLIGGLIAQWPLGALSDRVNRRYVIMLASVLVVLTSVALAFIEMWIDPSESSGIAWLIGIAVVFGAGFHPLYSLCIAHANDFIEPRHFVAASAGLQLVQGVGAIAGPLVGSLVMFIGGYTMLYLYVATVMAAFILYTLRRIIENREPLSLVTAPFRFLTRTGLFAFMMDPRSKAV